MRYPISTYRVQLNSSFTCRDLCGIIDYLHALGITTIYASPITTAVKGSMHGYDVIDSTSINPEIATLEELEQLAQKIKGKNMTWLQDIVPNHMAYSFDNPKVLDILERGKNSPYYTYFDIDWEHAEGAGRVLVPFLGEELNALADRNQLGIRFTENGFRLFCDEQEFPLSVNGLAILLPVMQEKGVPSELIDKLETLVQLADGANLEEWISIKKDFNASMQLHPENKKILEEFLNQISADANTIMRAIQAQPYLPVCYTISDSCMTYRRFFTINNLICLRIEDAFVFQDYHTLLFELYRRDLIQGFRLDHIDGLYDPLKYVQQLRQEVGEACYIIVEKILDSNYEELPESWCVEGTSGYEFLALCNRVLTNEEGAKHLIDFYKEFTGLQHSFEDIVYEKKHSFLYNHMQGELNNLMSLYNKLALKQEGIEDAMLRKALAVFMSAFPVYRIYPGEFQLTENERGFVQKAFERAMQKEPILQKEFHFIRNLFEKDDPETDKRKLLFIKRMMQYTSPLAAKGVEDTTFYIYNPLISHNEVGDSPAPLTISVDAFHEKMINRQKKTPYSLNATSTHDTKRAENARVRINSLSYVYKEWIECVSRWRAANSGFIQQVKGRAAPSLNDEYFIYQSLIGSFPETFSADSSFLERSKNFMIKGLREGKTETNYDTPDTEYENACLYFVESIVKADSSFLITFIPFLKKVIEYARIYSYAEIVLKSTAPGIPDFYQGCELEDLSYVDPDNRRSVDYNLRKEFLDQIQQKQGNELWEYITTNRSKGAEKLFVTHKMLLLRNNYSDVFLKGMYIPIKNQSNVLAYARQFESKVILVLIPLDAAILKEHADVVLDFPDGFPVKWTHVFSGKSIEMHKGVLSSVFSKFPVAVLEGENNP